MAQIIKDAERDLERGCGKLLFSAARFERYGQEEKAQQTFREVLLHFPGEDPAGSPRREPRPPSSPRFRRRADRHVDDRHGVPMLG